MVRIPEFHIFSDNGFDDVIASQRIVYLHKANPHRMKIAEQDRELLAAPELPLLVVVRFPFPQMRSRIGDYQTLIQPPRRGNVALSI